MLQLASALWRGQRVQMSLRLKMMLGISAILALVTLGYAAIAARAQQLQLQRLAQREAELVASVTSQAISIAMEQGKSEELQRILERIGRDETVVALRIRDARGVVLRSARLSEVGQTLPQTGSAPAETAVGVFQDATRQSIGSVRTIANAPACHGCHPATESTLGVLDVQVALDHPAAAIAQQFSYMILSAISGLVAAGLLIALLFTLLVGRRVAAMEKTIRRVEAGDLDARVSIGSNDEVGRLGQGFNAMVARLADERRLREERHAEELQHVEQLASLARMAAVGTMTSGVAHELNNPLNNITLTTEALMENLKEFGHEQIWDHLQDIAFEVERASETVGSLLDFARQEKRELAPLVVADLIRSTAGLAQNELSRHNVTVATEIPAGLPCVQGAFNSLRQVFLNLFLNAAQAMPAGGTLRVRAASEAAGRVCIEVEDTGVGIAPEALPHIFEPFYTTKETGQGTGLGLWVAYGIVNRHGGSITATSVVGQGTCFRVCLRAAGI